jgi:PAS domain S-box-containing protein
MGRGGRLAKATAAASSKLSGLGKNSGIDLAACFYTFTTFRTLFLAARGDTMCIPAGTAHMSQSSDPSQPPSGKPEESAAKSTLVQESIILRTLIDNLPDAIYAKDTAGRKILANPGDVKNAGCKTAAEVIGQTDFDLYPPDIANGYFADDQTVFQTGQPVLWREEYILDENAEKRWILTSKVPMRSPDGTIIGLVGIGRDITPLKKAEEKLETFHRELMVASRLAGMSEVATSMLHNLGNVLNSVNVSAAVILERLRKLRVDRVSEVAGLLRDHRGDLARFLSEDERGGKIVEFVGKLAEHLEQERNQLRSEAEGLGEKIQHISEIVAMQQTYARAAGVAEQVAIADLVEDALRIHAGAFERNGIAIVRHYETTPTLLVDRHKVLQILVNLLSNAEHACQESPQKQKQVALRIAAGVLSRVRIDVADNGVGIAPDHLTSIFSQGFTTRKDGHGFGLHSSALAARELGGSLTVHSEGLGKGATFTLELPAPRVPDPPQPGGH